VSNVHSVEEDVKLCLRIAKHEFLISWLMHIQTSSPYALPKHNHKMSHKFGSRWTQNWILIRPKFFYYESKHYLTKKKSCAYLHHPTFVATKSNNGSFVIKLIQNGCTNRFLCIHKMSCISKYRKHTCIRLLCTHKNPLKHLCVHKTPKRTIMNT